MISLSLTVNNEDRPKSCITSAINLLILHFHTNEDCKSNGNEGGVGVGLHTLKAITIHDNLMPPISAESKPSPKTKALSTNISVHRTLFSVKITFY
jgi:hypothetical protein